MAGHTYLTYGPLLNAATNVMYEGVPLHPDPSRMWQIVEKHKVCCTTLHAPFLASWIDSRNIGPCVQLNKYGPCIAVVNVLRSSG